MASKKRAADGTKTREQADTIARRSGAVAEDKAQRRQITQAISEGINEYKLQQKAKQREQDKKLKKAQADVERLKTEYAQKLKTLEANTAATKAKAAGSSKLPWILLAASWMLFVSVAAFYGAV